MGKDKEKPGPIDVKIIGSGPKEGLDVDIGDRKWFLVAVAVILVACVIGWASLHQYDAPKPSYSSGLDLGGWDGWRVLRTVGAIVAVLLALAVAVYLGARAFLALWEKRVEIKAADNAARQIHAQGGLYPWVISRDGDAAINPNAAPGNRIEGLNGCPVMPEAEAGTPAAEAVARASFVQIAAGAGFRSAAALADLMGNRPQQRPEMPDFVTIGPSDMERLPADVRRLLEVAEGEYRLLGVSTEGADDHGAYDPD